ncbi:DUF2171 domain-containing protein [Sphingomonas hengshuiensis]|uniref:SWFGD domain-containing protein n=1 Tax=Sphingomonas hengshuiensis TaxID=1609977 RepID=A0A7U4JA06_9SPHN|nr:DUF2171 domain-containing protein [Sphingomonas hengshuiensis]AJP72996.1 hypothetical protein TS85_16150 [Sphingomonas hengshuiensis]
MNDRNNRYGPRDGYGSRDTQDYGSGRDNYYSSARDYAAAGELGGRRDRSDYGAGAHRDDSRWQGGEPRYASQTRDWGGGSPAYRDQESRNRGYGSQSRRDGYGPQEQRGQDRYGDDRGFFERAGDEVRSWFGDEDAERRRERDQRYDDYTARTEGGRDSSGRDDHYHTWRRQRIAELDKDYDEYRRENAKRFEDEFSGWRTDRQGQRDSLRRVTEHMDVVGSDGSHVGTVDKVRGDRVILTKTDSEAGGHHHSIPSRWIHHVDDKVTLRKTADEAKAHWKDEERSGAMFDKDDAQDDSSWSTTGNLNRSFSGTY